MRKNFLGAAVILVLAFFSPSCAPRQDALTVHFIRVEDGNATLLQVSGAAVLVDAADLLGGYDVAQYLKKEKIETLDYLVLTHPHVDHFGGVFFVSRMFKVKNILDNGQDGGDLIKTGQPWGYHYNYLRAARRNKNYKALKRGDSFELKGARFKVYWPPSPPYAGNVNENSIVIMVEYGAFKCLLTSDITANVEKELLRTSGPGELKADVLQVSHHASIDASAEDFLKAVGPKTAVITAPKDMASSRVVARLRGHGAEVYRDSVGDVVIFAEKDGRYSVRQRA